MRRGICFTGKGYIGGGPMLSGFKNPPKLRPRSEWSAMAERMGWEVQDTVTADTHYLVCADAARATRKAIAAKAHGTVVMSYDEFQADYDQMQQSGTLDDGWQPSDPTPAEQDVRAQADDNASEALPGWGEF